MRNILLLALTLSGLALLITGCSKKEGSDAQASSIGGPGGTNSKNGSSPGPGAPGGSSPQRRGVIQRGGADQDVK